MLLSDAIDQYLGDRRAKGTAANTVRGEATVLRYFLATTGNIQTQNLEPRHVDRFWAARTYAPSTYNLYRSRLNGFFQWLRVRRHMSRTSDPLEGSRAQRVPKVMRGIVPADRFDDLLDAAKCDRDRAMLALGLFLFTRISETTALRWADLDLSSMTAQIYRRKTGEADTLPICSELGEELQRWRWSYGTNVGSTVKGVWYVIPPYNSRHFNGVDEAGKIVFREEARLVPHKPLSRPWPAIQAALDAIEIPSSGQGGHTLRRSGAIALYEELGRMGHDRAIRMCQAMLGHASVQTTERYLRLDLDRKARNDLLAGKPMFSKKPAGRVIELNTAEVAH